MVKELPVESGRQGSRGKPALYVLVASVGLMGLALAGLMAWQNLASPSGHADESQAASRKEITGSTSSNTGAASSANSSAVPAGNPAYPQPANRTAN